VLDALAEPTLDSGQKNPILPAGEEEIEWGQKLDKVLAKENE
jgi:hypothetical protein